MPVKYLDGIQSTSCKCVRGLTRFCRDYDEAYPKCACVVRSVTAKTLAVDPLSSDHSKNGGF